MKLYVLSEVYRWHTTTDTPEAIKVDDSLGYGFMLVYASEEEAQKHNSNGARVTAFEVPDREHLEGEDA